MQIEKVSNSNIFYWLKQYFALMKPGIIFGNITTASGGFLLASKNHLDLLLFFHVLLGLSLVISSGCVLNNFIDRNSDQKMKRTQNRALAKGEITPVQALVFALFLGITGSFILIYYANILSALIAIVGFVIYVIFYSFLKYKTVHATLMGSIAGAVPPVVGYSAMTNRLDMAALLLFLMVSMWQMPHFYAIAIYRMQEYKKAKIPVLPLVNGLHIAKIHMLLYILGFMGVCFSLSLLQYTGILFFVVALSLGLYWLKLCLEGFRSENNQMWARKMFVFSLITILSLCLVIPLSTL